MDAMDELAAANQSRRAPRKPTSTGLKPGQLGVGAIIVCSLLFGLIWYVVGLAKEKSQTPAPPVKVIIKEPANQAAPRSIFTPNHTPIEEKPTPGSRYDTPIQTSEGRLVQGNAPSQGRVWVNGYTKANGTHVSGYWRSR